MSGLKQGVVTKRDDTELQRLHRYLIIHSYGKDGTEAQQSTSAGIL